MGFSLQCTACFSPVLHLFFLFYQCFSSLFHYTLHLWFIRPVRNAFDAGKHITRASGGGFLGLVKWHRAVRRVPFGAQKSRDFQNPTPSNFLNLPLFISLDLLSASHPFFFSQSFSVSVLVYLSLSSSFISFFRFLQASPSSFLQSTWINQLLFADLPRLLFCTFFQSLCPITFACIQLPSLELN